MYRIQSLLECPNPTIFILSTFLPSFFKLNLYFFFLLGVPPICLLSFSEVCVHYLQVILVFPLQSFLSLIPPFQTKPLMLESKSSDVRHLLGKSLKQKEKPNPRIFLFRSHFFILFMIIGWKSRPKSTHRKLSASFRNISVLLSKVKQLTQLTSFSGFRNVVTAKMLYSWNLWYERNDKDIFWLFLRFCQSSASAVRSAAYRLICTEQLAGNQLLNEVSFVMFT